VGRELRWGEKNEEWGGQGGLSQGGAGWRDEKEGMGWLGWTDRGERGQAKETFEKKMIIAANRQKVEEGRNIYRRFNHQGGSRGGIAAYNQTSHLRRKRKGKTPTKEAIKKPKTSACGKRAKERKKKQGMVLIRTLPIHLP